MERPLSEEKRNAVLNAAAKVIAAEGIGAPTARIAKVAGVADGTVFKYFASTGKLLNELYPELKGEVARELLRDYPSRGELPKQARHIWTV